MAVNQIVQSWYEDPEFQDLSLSRKERIIANYFDNVLTKEDDPEGFIKLPEEDKRRIQANFIENNMAPHRMRPPSRGMLSDIMVAGGRAALGVPEMFLHAGAAADEALEAHVAPEGGGFDFKTWARATARDIEGFKEEELPRSEESLAGGPREWITGGIEAAGTSLMVKAPAAVAGFLAGGPPGAVLGWLSGVPLFSMAQYDQSLLDYRKRGLPEAEAREAALLEGASEGGFELLTDIVEIITLGTGTALTAPGKAVLKKSAFNAMKGAWKQAVKKGGVIAGAETLGELANVAVQAEVRHGTGVDDQRAWGAVKDNLGTIAVASLIFGSLGGGLNLTNARVTRKLLEDPAADPLRRMAAVKEVANSLRKTSPEVAKRWTEGAVEAVTAREAIRMDVQTDLDDAVAAARPVKEADIPKPVKTQPVGDTGTETTEMGEVEEPDEPRTLEELEELLSPGQIKFIKDQVKIHGPEVAAEEVLVGYDIAQEYAKRLGEEEREAVDVEREGLSRDIEEEEEPVVVTEELVGKKPVPPPTAEVVVGLDSYAERGRTDADRLEPNAVYMAEEALKENVGPEAAKAYRDAYEKRMEEKVAELKAAPKMKERRVEVPLSIFQYGRLTDIINMEDSEFVDFGKEGKVLDVSGEPEHKVGTLKTPLSRGLSHRHSLEDIVYSYLVSEGAIRPGEEGKAPVINLQAAVKARQKFTSDLEVELEAEIARVEPEEPVVERREPGVKPRKPTESKVRTLRGKLKEMGGINFLNYTGELKDMPIDVKVLAKKTGDGIDNVVDRLVSDGWLDKGSTVASFLEDLRTKPEILKRDKVIRDVAEKEDYELSPQERRLKEEEAWEPEAPPEGEYVKIRAEDLPEGKEFTIIEGKSREGWDRYQVIEKDPFSITLQDGEIIELKPLDIIEVLREEIEGTVPLEEVKVKPPKVTAAQAVTGRKKKRPSDLIVLPDEKKSEIRARIIDEGSKAAVYEKFDTDSMEDRFARQEADNLADQMGTDEWPYGIERPDQRYAREQRETKAIYKKADTKIKEITDKIEQYEEDLNIDIERIGTGAPDFMLELSSARSRIGGILERSKNQQEAIEKGYKRADPKRFEASKRELEEEVEAIDLSEPKYNLITGRDYGGVDTVHPTAAAAKGEKRKVKYYQEKGDYSVGLVFDYYNRYPSYWSSKHKEGAMSGIGPTMEEAIEDAKVNYAREVEFEKEITKETYTPKELDVMKNWMIRTIAMKRGIEKYDTKRIKTLKDEILKTKKREDPRIAAIGVISGGKVEQAEEEGWRFDWAERIGALEKGTDRYYDLVGILSGGKVDQLMKAGLSASFRKPPAKVTPKKAPKVEDQVERKMIAKIEGLKGDLEAAAAEKKNELVADIKAWSRELERYREGKEPTEEALEIYPEMKGILEKEPVEYEWLREDETLKIDPAEMTDEQYAVARSMRSFTDAVARTKAMQDKGPVSDDVVKEWISEEFGIQGGQSDPRLVSISHKGGKNPEVEFGDYTDEVKTKIKGKKLIETVRDLYGLPYETEIGKEPVGKPGSSDKTANWVMKKLAGGYSFTWKELFSQADKDFGGTQSEGAYTVKDAYDAMELGINRLINNDLTINPNKFLRGAEKDVRDLKTLIEKMPTQTKRTEETDEFQQFSTPPPLAYIVNWAANINENDVVLEPSAGVGGIAVFSKLADADQVIVNELSPRRAELLKLMGFDQVFTENAEQIHNILPKDVKPSVVVMNPPFSSTAGRIKGRRATEIGAKHIEQALARLEPNGRLVAIVGKGMADDAPAFSDWWGKIKEKYNVQANIGIDGKDYRKYGTTFDNQILVIDKTGKTDDTIVTGKVESFEELPALLKGVRDARIPKGKRPPGEPGREEGAEEPGPGPVVLPTGRRARPEEREPDRGVSPITGQPGKPPVPPGPGRGDEVPGRRARPEKRPAEEPGPPTGVRGRPGAPTQPTVSDASRISEAESATAQVQIKAIEKEASGEMTEDLYESYTPELLEVPGGKKHPTPLVQSAAMAAVTPPQPTYKPSLPENIIKQGKLSKSQIEPVVYAGQSHEQILRDGSRRGYFVGDGTGVGKGRIIAGIMWDNWNKGRKKAVWLSEKATLVNDAKRDVEGTGWDPDLVFPMSKINSSSEIKAKQGILFMTYDTLKQVPTPEAKERGAISRMEQVLNWLGEDFDGVIAFDESHNMGNAISIKGPRGTSKPAAKALAGVDLQRKLPNSRKLYVSATGATEVRNLSYAESLGLWGAGTAFPNEREFINGIAGGGIAAMEMIAQNMKATGVYTSRALSYDGVEYDEIVHELTPAQVSQYDKMVDAWQVVLQNFEKALEITDGDKSGHAKGRARAIFWGENLRFFNQVITSMKLPSVINKIHADLKDGKSVVIQLVSTLEAAQKRALAKLTEEDGLEDLDLSPFDNLMQMVERSFPVAQFEGKMDEKGNIQYVPVYDSEGNNVKNAEAEDMRDRLLDELGVVRREVADGAIDQIIAEFGVDNVAEVTGRSRRVVEKVTEKGTEKVIEKRSDAKANADADAFMNGKKKILIFSEKGGTGRSYHSDMDAINQDQRSHYLLQPGWRADKALQGLGRTHRSNQKHPPIYQLVRTNLKGEARFMASIARRLDQVGALTRGARETGSQGIFSAKDNLETDYAEDALQILFKDLHQGRVPDMTVGEFERQTALEITDEYGNLKSKQVKVKNLLNRILSMRVNEQNRLFSEFTMRLDDVIDAHIEAGTLDVGLETLKADKIEKIGEETVFTDEKSGAETKYVQLSVTKPSPMLKYEDAKEWAADGFYKNVKSGKVWAARKRDILNRKTGEIEDKYVLQSTTMTQQRLPLDRVKDVEKWVKVDEKEAKSLWQEAIDELPKTITEERHLVTGALLPIWNRLIGHPRIMRVQTDAGEKMIGRLIAPQDLQKTLKNLGATGAKVKLTPKEAHTQILANNYRMELANGWTLSRRIVSDDYRIEIQGPQYSDFQILKNYGVFSERIAYQTRFFIPTDASGVKAIEEIIRDAPIVEALPPAAQYAVKEAPVADLAGVTVTVKAVMEDTGKAVSYQEDAKTALDEINEQITTYEQMLDCISG